MLVDEKLVVEAKATAMLDKSASRQVYNYLCATRLQVGPYATRAQASEACAKLKGQDCIVVRAR